MEKPKNLRKRGAIQG
jgi:hypothetical protein